jgi:hypothetical protein
MNPTTPSLQTITEIDTRVAGELAAITTDENGRRKITVAQLEPLAVHTHLVLLFASATDHVPLADEETMSFLGDKYYNLLHSSRGGLSWEAFNEYARGCKHVADAAQRHREYIGAKKT